MANPKIKSEGGQGGRRGHSNMSHWTGTEEIKEASRKRRRLDSKKIIATAMSDIQTKKISPTTLAHAKKLLKASQAWSKKVGLTPSDIKAALRRVRVRSR